MRMWAINVKFLCRKHLTGEHGEIHKFLKSFQRNHSIFGRIYPVVQIEPSKMKRRHDELAAEMTRRGGNHKSPYNMPDISYLPEDQRNAKADIRYNIVDLCSRCDNCKELILSSLEVIQ